MDSYDYAMEEAQKAEEQKNQQLILEQQKIFEMEKLKLE
jgi:hypothetical protein